MNKKIALSLVLLVVICSSCDVSRDMYYDYGSNPVVRSGVGLGSVMAVVTSWTRNRSLLWALIHSIFGWLYVIYFQVTRKPEEQRF